MSRINREKITTDLSIIQKTCLILNSLFNYHINKNDTKLLKKSLAFVFGQIIILEGKPINDVKGFDGNN